MADHTRPDASPLTDGAPVTRLTSTLRHFREMAERTTGAESELWQRLADEIDAWLCEDDEQEGLF